MAPEPIRAATAAGGLGTAQRNWYRGSQREPNRENVFSFFDLGDGLGVGKSRNRPIWRAPAPWRLGYSELRSWEYDSWLQVARAAVL